MQEANPNHAREEPSRTSDATWRGLQGVWVVSGQSHWQVTGPSLREPRKGRAPAVKAVSQSSSGSAAEDAQHSRKSGSRRDALSLPARKSPARSSLNPECGILRPQLHAQPESCAEVARCEVGARPRARAVRRSVRKRAGCRGSRSWNGAGSGFLAECIF